MRRLRPTPRWGARGPSPRAAGQDIAAAVRPISSGTARPARRWRPASSSRPDAASDAHYLEPSHGIDRHYTISLTLVRDHGRWQVVKDTVTDVVA
ncbi:hypothetical protein ILP97_46560 [Amycolatopsis sp. H6(2020)]|nr:hypothetical protein [Amycolatopsis sp. H6(2020)]